MKGNTRSQEFLPSRQKPCAHRASRVAKQRAAGRGGRRDMGRGRGRVPSFRRGLADPRLRVPAAPLPRALAAGVGAGRGARLLAVAAPMQWHRRAHGRHHVACEGARGRSGPQGPTRAVRAWQAGPRLLHHAAAAAARTGGPGPPGAPHARGAAAAAVLGNALGRRHPLRDLRRQRPVRGPNARSCVTRPGSG